jgi:hypothetical protein
MANAAIRIAILADAANATKGIGAAGKALAGLATAVAGGVALDFFKGAVSEASDLQEAASKVNVVFGKQAPIIEKAAKSAASSMGLSESAYLSATGTLGNLLVSLDIAPNKAAAMSQQMVKLAGDLASFNNVSPEEALEALKSGLTGEAEPLKRFGVNMNDATLTAEALKLGLIKTTKDALNPQVKALAAQSLIMSQTKTAQGDFARTSSGLANQQRILAAKFADAKASIGKVFLPIVTRAVTLLVDKVIPAFAKAGPAISDMGQVVQAKVVPVLKTLGEFLLNRVVPALAAMAKFVAKNKDFFVPFAATILAIAAAVKVWVAVQTVLNIVLTANPIGLLVVAIAALVAGVIYAYKHSEKFRNIINALGNAAKAVGSAIVGFFTGIPGALSTAVSFVQGLPGKIAGWIGSLATTLYNKGREAIVGMAKGFASYLSSFAGSVGKLAGSIARWVGSTAKTLYSKGREIIVGFAKGYASYLSTLAGSIGKLLGSIGRWVGNGARTLYSKGRQIIVGFAQGYASYLATLSGALGKLLSSIVRWVGDGARTLYSKGRQIIVGFAQGYASYLSTLATTIGNLGGNILRWVGDMGSKLYSSGRTLIQGLIDGIKSKAADVASAVTGIAGVIKDHFPGSPVRTGPLRSWNNGGAGRRLLAMLNSGLRAEAAQVQRTISRLSAGIESGLSAEPRIALGVSAGRGNVTAPTASAPVINVYALSDGPDVGRRVIAAITEYERSNGARWRS